MSAVEEMEAAIATLTSLRDEANYHEMNGWLAEVVEGASGAIDDPGYAPLTNDPIIVTLYRTIDAQLAMLREVVIASEVERNWETLVYTETALSLARAINGPIA